MSQVTLGHIQAATAVLTQIAFSGGEGVEPSARLALWRHNDGIEPEALEAAARESADGSFQEILDGISESGDFDFEVFREYLEREYMTAFQIGWIARGRRDKRDEEDHAD